MVQFARLPRTRSKRNLLASTWKEEDEYCEGGRKHTSVKRDLLVSKETY